MYIDKLDNIADKYNNTYHKTIKLKPPNVKSDTYIDYGLEHIDKDHKFKVGWTCNNINIQKYAAKWRVTVSGELRFITSYLESWGFLTVTQLSYPNYIENQTLTVNVNSLNC